MVSVGIYLAKQLGGGGMRDWLFVLRKMTRNLLVLLMEEQM